MLVGGVGDEDDDFAGAVTVHRGTPAAPKRKGAAHVPLLQRARDGAELRLQKSPVWHRQDCPLVSCDPLAAFLQTPRVKAPLLATALQQMHPCAS